MEEGGPATADATMEPSAREKAEGHAGATLAPAAVSAVPLCAAAGVAPVTPTANKKTGKVKKAVVPSSPETVVIELTEDRVQKIEQWAKEAEEKNAKGGTNLWPTKATLVLIEHWGEKYVGRQSVGLKPKHWRQVVANVNAQLQKGTQGPFLPYTTKQARDRIELLKKTHKQELEKN